MTWLSAGEPGSIRQHLDKGTSAKRQRHLKMEVRMHHTSRDFTRFIFSVLNQMETSSQDELVLRTNWPIVVC